MIDTKNEFSGLLVIIRDLGFGAAGLAHVIVTAARPSSRDDQVIPYISGVDAGAPQSIPIPSVWT